MGSEDLGQDGESSDLTMLDSLPDRPLLFEEVPGTDSDDPTVYPAETLFSERGECAVYSLVVVADGKSYAVGFDLERSRWVKIAEASEDEETRDLFDRIADWANGRFGEEGSLRR